MSYQHHFHVEDVTCEKCDARVRNALLALPGAQQVEYVRTPQDEAEVVFTTTEIVSPTQIEEAIEQQSAGTTHHYRVRWT
ncbi:MAG TPA: heavy-metal-associated domain-containing protein [Ktedonobacteraceae bacterium]|nr:heavy-metal-associated domain-containing protein [Ktedonobacteraceae bacterium]